MIKTKIKPLLGIKRIAALSALLVLILTSGFGFSKAQNITQGYDSDEVLQKGMIIRLDGDDPTKVKVVTTATAEEMHGVVVDPNDAPVTLSNEGEKVFVATTGRYEVLVSDQNGSINPGEFITISALSGIGMKVDDLAPVVVGKALVGFDGSNSVGVAQVGDRTVRIARIMADISISRNPLQRPTQANVPEFLRQAAETIAGKSVSTARIYISLVIFIVSSFIAASLMYSGVRSSIISIGRNPLSKKSIIKGMLQVILTALIIFICGIFGVYLLLRL